MTAPFRDISDIVRIAVGFSTVSERSRSRDGKKKAVAHQVTTPWQLMLTSTRRAIKREDDLVRYSDSHEAMFDLFDMSDPQVGMRPWLDWWRELKQLKKSEPDWKHRAACSLPREKVKLHDDRLQQILQQMNMEDLRHAVFIERYTDSKEQATEWLGKPAQDGWNKNGKHIVILNGRRPVVDTDWKTRNLRWSFGPIGTAWLAAMAPRADNRLLVIRHAIGLLGEFYNEDSLDTPTFQGDLKAVESKREWYAHHTLRRMFRLRFGCSMTNCEEIAGPLDTFKPSKDVAWIKYKKGVREALQDLAAKQAE